MSGRTCTEEHVDDPAAAKICGKCDNFSPHTAEAGICAIHYAYCYVGALATDCPNFTSGASPEAKLTPGRKDDSGKTRYNLVPPRALEGLAKVLTFGAKKYGAWNWRNVEDPCERYYAAAMRHIEAWRMGEILDPESGLPHLDHALADLTFLREVGPK